MTELILHYFSSVILFITILVGLNYAGKTYKEIELGSSSQIIATILTAFIISYYISQRPLDYSSGDTGNYVFVFEQVQKGALIIQNEIEPIWNLLLDICLLFTDARGYITLISFMYIFFTAIASIIIFPKNSFIGFLFNLGALSFLTYGTNGIRNGLACSLLLLGIAILTKHGVWKKIIGVVIAFIAMGIHKSTMLPIGMAVISMFFIKDFRICYKFWIAAIVISLIAGNSIGDFFASLGFDDRLSYLQEAEDTSRFNRIGFRWDFLIYSAMPIWLGYYVIFKRGIRNRNFEFLLNTYTLSNAFWVMVIRAAYSNRFAYLSWFLFPIVLAYPALKMDVWGDEQGKRLAQIMIAQVGFTWFMETFYW